MMAPIYSLQSKKSEKSVSKGAQIIPAIPVIPAMTSSDWSVTKEFNWDIHDEYDPLKPNDYEKIMKERREKAAEDIKRDRDRKRRHDQPSNQPSGFAGRPGRPESDEEDDFSKKSNVSANKAAIAPPPSLQDMSDPGGINTYGASSVAAKIMAKYGFKDGQGLGKQEQGMSIALQVEKTSKRGGRIIHEKELMPPPTFLAPATPSSGAAIPGSITPLTQRNEQTEQSITEIIKSPSKVVLLRVRI